jgi:hypothetical protein
MTPEMGGSSEQNIMSKVFVLDTEKRPLVPQGGSQKSKVKSQNEDSIGFWRI